MTTEVACALDNGAGAARFWMSITRKECLPLSARRFERAADGCVA
jgi:hypothetical protein